MAKAYKLKATTLLLVCLCLFFFSCSPRIMVLKIQSDGVEGEMYMSYNKKFKKMMKDSLGIEIQVIRKKRK